MYSTILACRHLTYSHIAHNPITSRAVATGSHSHSPLVSPYCRQFRKSSIHPMVEILQYRHHCVLHNPSLATIKQHRLN